MSSNIRVVVADGSDGCQSHVRDILQNAPDIEIVAEVRDRSAVANAVVEYRPDILLLNFAILQDVSGSLAQSNEPDAARVIALMDEIERTATLEAFLLGAHGVVSRQGESLCESIRCVRAGRYWLENQSAGILVQTLRELLTPNSGAAQAPNFGLTRRELEIVAKIASGRSNREVGEEFSISERTVKHHLTNIFNKVGVTSRLQLALFAVTHQLMAPTVSARVEGCCEQP